jgi:hypothetical protein
MNDQPVPYMPTDKATILSLQARVDELEHMLRHFDRSSMHLLHYVRGITGGPDMSEWQLVVEQVQDMVDPYGPRNPNR